MDDNLEVIKETLLFPHTEMWLNCTVIESSNPHFNINPLSSGLSPLSSKKIQTPQVTQFLEGPTPLSPPPPFNKVGFQLWDVIDLVLTSLLFTLNRFHIVLMFPMLNANRLMAPAKSESKLLFSMTSLLRRYSWLWINFISCSSVSIVEFEKSNAGSEKTQKNVCNLHKVNKPKLTKRELDCKFLQGYLRPRLNKG